MMRTKLIVLSATTAMLLSSCAPPPYSADSYIGSLYQCLDIQGTYEKGGFLSFFLPKSFSDALNKGINEKAFTLQDGKNNHFKKTWLSFRFLDGQNLEAILFNIDGQFIKVIINMEKKEDLSWDESEQFACSRSSWEKSTYASKATEGHNHKWRSYSKITMPSNNSIKGEYKSNTWGGYFPGLYLPDKGDVDSIGYYRKVDLTVDDIRAGNEKARRAIEQYDQVATTPPPQ